jgi:chromosome segregation ATPase
MTGGMNQNISRNTKVFSLPITNTMRYDKISSLSVTSEEIKPIISKIEDSYKKNSLVLESCDNDLKQINENFKEVINQGSILAKYVKLLDSKNRKIKVIVDYIKTEMSHQTQILERQKRSFNMLHESNAKITIPNDYFFQLIGEIDDKIHFQIQQFTDLYALTDLYYKKENGDLDINPDAIEEMINDVNQTLQYMIAESETLDETSNHLRKTYTEFMMRESGFSENEIVHRLKYK